MPPGKGCEHGDPAFLRSFPESLFIQHAFQVRDPDRKGLPGPGCYRFGGGKERLFTVAAEKTLGAVFTGTVFNYMAAATEDAAMTRRDPRLNQKRLNMTVSQTEGIWDHGIKSRLVTKRQLFIGDNRTNVPTINQ